MQDHGGDLLFKILEEEDAGNIIQMGRESDSMWFYIWRKVEVKVQRRKAADTLAYSVSSDGIISRTSQKNCFRRCSSSAEGIWVVRHLPDEEVEKLSVKTIEVAKYGIATAYPRAKPYNNRWGRPITFV
ncbi:hypothetical protein V8G54_006214 [Vigna mungo]|uniref:Uncharacterized protein n=1 Tax=Vigna mungo TaxID=3915 RepID=A0AAQ3P1S9_VIGMU